MQENNQPLITSDLQLQFLLNASPVGMLVFNDRGEIILANPPAENLFDLCSNIDSLKRWGDFIRCTNRLRTPRGCGHSTSCPSCPLLRGLRATLAGTATTDNQEGEATLDREPGCEPLWIRYKIKPLAINGQRGALLTVDDITALRRSEQQYAQLFREMLNAFALHEILCDDQGLPVDYRFLAVNPAFERLIGLSSAQIVGRTVLSVLPHTEPHWISTYGKVALTGEPIRFENYSREIGKHFSINAFCPAPGQFACLFEDITERKQVKEELKKNEANYRSTSALLRSLCDNLPDMIWAKDLKNRYLFANAALCRNLLSAVDTEEPLGKSDLFFAERERACHADQTQWHTFGELCRDSDTATLEAGVPMQFDEFGNIRGHFLFLDVHKAPFIDENGTLIGTVGSARDVTAVKEMERQLREREERLDLAIREADLGTWDWHIPSGTIVTNQRWVEMLGLTAEEVEPNFGSWMALVHPDDLARVNAALARHLAGNTYSYETEHRLHHKSGEWIWVLDKGRVIERDAQGNPLRACGTHLDITHQKILIEQSRDGIVILDSRGKVRQANQRFADMLGYTPEEVQQLHVWDWDTQWTREQLLEAIDLIDATGDFFETFQRRKDGTIFPVEISSNGSMCAGEKMVFCVCRDITERKKAEETIRHNERRLRKLVDILQHPADQAQEFLDHALEQAIELTGSTIGFLLQYHEERQECVLCSWSREIMTSGAMTNLQNTFHLEQAGFWGEAIRNRRPVVINDFEADHPLKRGTPEGHIELRTFMAVPIVKDDRVVGVVGLANKTTAYDENDMLQVSLLMDSVYNIAERKRMEVERSRLQAQLVHAQKMEAIGTLAGGIAHDFNNILAAVIGYAEMAREDSPPGSILARDLDRVLEAGNRAASLVRQILAFSRQQDSERVPLDPCLIVKEVVKLLRPSLPSTIAINHRLTASRCVLADPTQLHQVLMNLATDAFHAMEQTGGSLEIVLEDIDCSEDDLALHPGIVPGPFVRLSVADTGPGIPPEIRDRIFDPYFTTKGVGKGTGMGLAIVDGIVRGSGGFITCESGPGRGTIFSIFLPIFDGEAPLVGEKTEPVASGSGRILLVDDEEILIEMGQAMLERLGYEVTVRTSSLEALTTFQNDPHRFDAVITDQTMPGMTGVDLARRMLQIRPDLPIILCTGYSNLVTEDQAKSYGIKGFTMKPLTMKEVSTLLRMVLDLDEGAQ